MTGSMVHEEPRPVGDRLELLEHDVEAVADRIGAGLDERVPAAERVVGIAEAVEAKDPEACRRPRGRVRRQERRLGEALLEVLHDHRGLRQAEPVALEHGHLAERVLLVDPLGSVGEVDRDRLDWHALLREDDADAGAVRTAGCVVEAEHAAIVAAGR